MAFDEIVNKLTPDIYARLKLGVELGKWPDGKPLSAEQKAICMEAVLAWEHAKNMPEHDRTGFIDRGRKADGETCNDEEQVLKIKDSN